MIGWLVTCHGDGSRGGTILVGHAGSWSSMGLKMDLLSTTRSSLDAADIGVPLPDLTEEEQPDLLPSIAVVHRRRCRRRWRRRRRVAAVVARGACRHDGLWSHQIRNHDMVANLSNGSDHLIGASPMVGCAGRFMKKMTILDF
ncbi:hypothetical protein ACLOJK_002867 [Asimina triloba]